MRRRAKSKTGEGRDKLVGERFRAAVRHRMKRRKLEKAGRKAARRGK